LAALLFLSNITYVKALRRLQKYVKKLTSMVAMVAVLVKGIKLLISQKDPEIG
jgi:hypothetical protein